MAGILGILGYADTDRVMMQTVGQRVVFEAAQQWLAQVNAELDAATGLFIEAETEDYTERYKLPGGGRLQRRGGLAPSGTVKASGQWDVSYPLEGFGASTGQGRIAASYMTLQDVQRHLDTVVAQNTNTVRFEMLRRLFNNTLTPFIDELHGTLNVQPLANGDPVVYPPVLGSEVEAVDDHYLESGYLANAISDVNNPYRTMRQELEEHFGVNSGGEEIVVFINPAERALSEALADFDAIPDRFVRPGVNTDIPVALPQLVPGVVLGRVSGVWCVEWRWIPTGYMLGIHLAAPAPLKRRVDPADTGLPRGLAMVAESDTYPMETAHYENRFGFGVGNRLNGVVMELANGGGYTIPAAFV